MYYSSFNKWVLNCLILTDPPEIKLNRIEDSIMDLARWHETTLVNVFEHAKAVWPVSSLEAVFLPEFKIGSISEHQFQIIHLIDKGAFGHVYKVREKSTDRIYAMKILQKSKIIQERCVDQVKDEVSIQSMCGHFPFIVSCPFYWQSRKELFIVSDYLESGDLFSFCSQYGPLPEDICRIYIAELALALDFLHNAGVMHRDLKPTNVMLDSDYHAVLIDFGLAKWVRFGERTQTICGSPEYMAPEVFSLIPYNHAVDWWSLGVLACYLLTSSYPGRGNLPEGAGLLPPASSSLSAPAKDLLSRLLTVDPTRRLRSLLSIQNVAFFMGVKFNDIREKKASPKDLLALHYPDGPVNPILIDNSVFFYDFDSMSPIIV